MPPSGVALILFCNLSHEDESIPMLIKFFNTIWSVALILLITSGCATYKVVQTPSTAQLNVDSTCTLLSISYVDNQLTKSILSAGFGKDKGHFAKSVYLLPGQHTISLAWAITKATPNGTITDYANCNLELNAKSSGRYIAHSEDKVNSIKFWITNFETNAIETDSCTKTW